MLNLVALYYIVHMLQYIFNVYMFVSMATGDGGAGSIEKEWLFCAARRGEAQVNNK